MKKYLALLLFALITTLSFGQSNYQDVVYLKNGKIIRGMIIEYVPNKSIKIETTDGTDFVYQIDEIEKFTKEPIQGKSSGSINNSGLQSGYKGIIELGYQIYTNYGMDRLVLNIINGYQINPYFSLGFGTGFRYYSGSEGCTDAVLMPIFADLRANFINNNGTPYLSLGIGYSFDVINSFKSGAIYSIEGGGFLLNPTIGISVKVSKKAAINIGIGYEIQRIKVLYSHYDYHLSSPYGYTYEDTEKSGAISITVGISF